MTERQQFILGFLGRCAQEGLTEAETSIRIEALEQTVKTAAEGGLGVWDTIKVPLLLTSLASLGVGAGGGYLAAHAGQPQLEPEELKQQELLAAYRHYTNLMRRASRQRLPVAPRTPRLLSH
jgi:hypothetical protein